MGRQQCPRAVSENQPERPPERRRPQGQKRFERPGCSREQQRRTADAASGKQPSELEPSRPQVTRGRHCLGRLTLKFVDLIRFRLLEPPGLKVRLPRSGTPSLTGPGAPCERRFTPSTDLPHRRSPKAPITCPAPPFGPGAALACVARRGARRAAGSPVELEEMDPRHRALPYWQFGFRGARFRLRDDRRRLRGRKCIRDGRFRRLALPLSGSRFARS
jgi:hypothetical protein